VFCCASQHLECIELTITIPSDTQGFISPGDLTFTVVIPVLLLQFDQNDLGVQLGSMVLMEKGQPLPFDKAAANKYLKVCGRAGVKGPADVLTAGF
jgi:hypothetical protein